MKTKPDKIAIRYGGVLFELAHSGYMVKDVLKDMSRLRNCIEAEPNEWLRVVSPALPLYTQRRIIEKLVVSLKLGNLLSHFVLMLCQNRRLPHVNLIFEEFLERARRAEGIVDGVLETALEVSDKEIAELQKSLKSQLGKSVDLRQEINESLLGGVTLTIGSLMIDASTRTRLNKLRTAMKG